MLDREGQKLQVKEVLPAQQTIDVKAQGMSSQLGVQASTQALEGMSTISLEVELLDQLSVDRLYYLAYSPDRVSNPLRELLLLIGARDCHQHYTVLREKVLSNGFADVPFIPYHNKVGMLTEQLITTCMVGDVGREEFKVDYHPSQRDEQLHLVTKHHSLFRGDVPERCSVGNPVFGGLGSKVELHHRHRQRVYTALAIICHVENIEYHAPEQVECLGECPSASVEAALGRDIREQMWAASPLGQHNKFTVPPLALSNHAHCHKLTVRTDATWAWSAEIVADVLPNIVHYAVDPQTKVVKVANSANSAKLLYVRYH